MKRGFGNVRVNLTLKNRDHKATYGTLQMRAVHLKKKTKSTQVLMSEGNPIQFNLNGYQEKSFYETLESPGKPSSINLTIINKIQDN